MAATDTLLKPEECVMLLVDFQAGLGFGVESSSRQFLLNNAVALARTAAAFNVPVVVSTSASRVYSGPLLPALQDALSSVKAIERKNMNVWEDDHVELAPQRVTSCCHERRGGGDDHRDYRADHH